MRKREQQQNKTRDRGEAPFLPPTPPPTGKKKKSLPFYLDLVFVRLLLLSSCLLLLLLSVYHIYAAAFLFEVSCFPFLLVSSSFSFYPRYSPPSNSLVQS